MKYLECELAEDHFGFSNTPKYNFSRQHNGDASIDWLINSKINTQNRAYQREKVALLQWKQNIIHTVLIKDFAGIPEIHIRVIKTESGYCYELIDGQQRVTAIIDFLNDKFPLPSNFVVENVDCSGMYATDLFNEHRAIYERIVNYRISCKWYEELTDIETAFLFIYVLNNVNDMKPAEIRNAVLGPYSEFVRDTSRFSPHELFTRTTYKTGKTEKTRLEYFSKSFSLNGRMEVDDWLSTLIYLWKNDFKNGITNNSHLKWVEEQQAPNGEYNKRFTDVSKIETLLSFGLRIIKNVNKKYREKVMTPMISLIFILYGDFLKSKYGKINEQKYAKAFFEVYEKYSDEKECLYAEMKMHDGRQMPPFKNLFGGKNKNAIKSICKILDLELNKDQTKFGVVQIDQRDFTRAEIVKKWKEQDYKCYYTGDVLESDNLAGDHFIPRSWGIDKGGVTEYHNLVVTSESMNRRKGNTHGEDFMKMLKEEKE